MEEVFLILMDIEVSTHMGIDMIILMDIEVSTHMVMNIIIHMDMNINKIRDVIQYNLEITILTINIEIQMDFLINIDINMLIIILFLILILIINSILQVNNIKDMVVVEHQVEIFIHQKDKEQQE